MKNFVVKGAQKGAEKVLMANVLACTGVISLVEKMQEKCYDGAVVLRSKRLEIAEEQAAKELKAQHDEVVSKAKASADRIRGILSKKSISVQLN